MGPIVRRNNLTRSTICGVKMEMLGKVGVAMQVKLTLVRTLETVKYSAFTWPRSLSVSNLKIKDANPATGNCFAFERKMEINKEIVVATYP